METFGDAFPHTGRLQPFIEAVFAVVALDDLSGIRIPLWGTPGAGGDTGLAPDTKGWVNKDDAVFYPFLHSARRAGRHTPGLLTVKTGHKDVGHTGQIVDHLGPHGNDLTQPGADRQVFVGLAVHFATKTPDAPFAVLKQK